MAQKTYQGVTLLDLARSIVELFLKQRVRDASARGDRYMLMSFEDFPMNVKAGWRESQSVFQEQLKLLKPRGLTSFGTALGNSLRFLNVNRLQTGIDSFGSGRYPFYIEPVVIICITDGSSLTCPASGTVNEIKVAKPTAIGNELTEEPFRWDQRLYSLVLRIPGSSTTNARVTPGMALPADNSPIDAMCMATGGRSYCVTSHKMLSLCVESLVQRLQQQGIVLRFEKIGPDPPLVLERVNGVIENGSAKKNGELNGCKMSGSEDWHSVSCIVYSRGSRTYPGHWPIPEAFWPDRSMTNLPPRKAHPVISFRCESSEPLVCQDFPFDKYELEPSPLTKFILSRKQPNFCWQVFITNSCAAGSKPAPFGYLKAATNMSCVNLFIMPYNYPHLLPLVEELKADPKAKSTHSWRLRLEKYLSTMPSYYLQPLKKALARLNISHPMLEPEQMQQYSYNILSYVTKVKHMARDEFESLCSVINNTLQQSIAPPVSLIPVQGNTRNGSIEVKKIQHSGSDIFSGYQIQDETPKLLIAPSAQFRNPFEIKRENLLDQVPKMFINLMQQLSTLPVSIFVGGRPGTSIKLQHAEDLHNLPISQMGNYQEYIKGLEAIGRSPLREVEPQAIRAHAFGNPFKIDKKNMTVDEVGEGSLLGGSTKAEMSKKRASLASSTPSTSEVPRLPRRKAGPLAPDSLSRWRRRRRENSSSSSTISSNSDLDSVSSLDFDLSANDASLSVLDDRQSSSNTVSESSERLCSSLSKKRSLSNGSLSETGPPFKKSCIDEPNLHLDESALNKKKLLMGKFVRQLSGVEQIMRLGQDATDGLSTSDRRACTVYALREARRFKRRKLAERLNNQLDALTIENDI